MGISHDTTFSFSEIQETIKHSLELSPILIHLLISELALDSTRPYSCHETALFLVCELKRAEILWSTLYLTWFTWFPKFSFKNFMHKGEGRESLRSDGVCKFMDSSSLYTSKQCIRSSLCLGGWRFLSHSEIGCECSRKIVYLRILCDREIRVRKSCRRIHKFIALSFQINQWEWSLSLLAFCTCTFVTCVKSDGFENVG